MPTPVFVCGAECGIAVVGTLSAGTEHWSSIGGTPTVVTSGPATMRSTRAFRMNPTAAAVSLRHTFATAIASPATGVARFYIYFASLPTSNCILFEFNGGSGGTVAPIFVSSDSTIRAGGASATLVASSGAVVTTGVWYRIDAKGVFNTTTTCDIQVDGAAQTQYSVAGSAQTCIAVRVGTVDSETFDIYYDDLVVSGTSGDYPIGAGIVAGLYPSADGTHGGGWAAGVFGKGASGATNASTSDTTLWQDLDNPLVSTAAGNWISDLTGTATSNYVEFVMDDIPAATSVNGAMLVATTHSASAVANQFNLAISKTGGSSPGTALIAAALSVTTITIPVAVRNTDVDAVAWTRTTVNDVRFRFSSTDSNPDVFLDGICFEVDYIPAPAVPSYTVMKGRVAWTPAG